MILGITIISLLIIGYFIYTNIGDLKLLSTVTNTRRGTYSERALVIQLLKMGIPANMIFHDLYLKKENGKYSQSDVIAITSVGIIVFEVKDYSGWLFGNGHQQEWTQVLNYGKQKHRFYNPILQNNTHIEEWKRKYPELQNFPFFSVIVFYGNCELKKIDYIPVNCYVANAERINEVYMRITSQNAPVEISNMENIRAKFLEAAANGNSKEIQQQHTRNIHEMMSKDRLYH